MYMLFKMEDKLISIQFKLLKCFPTSIDQFKGNWTTIPEIYGALKPVLTEEFLSFG